MQPSDRVFVTGVNHLGAPVDCRQRAAVPSACLADALRAVKERAGLSEIVIVSTCSRVEVYGAAEDPAEAARVVEEWFAERAGPTIRPALYSKLGADAFGHLFRVASGLDSWIIGETEILAQVKDAYQAALAAGMTRRLLNKLFQRALAGGKAVRTRTGIQNGIHSIGGAAALLAKRIFREGSGGTVVVFGAGQAAEAVARHLAAKNFSRIVVANRTLEKARAVSAPLGGEAVSFEDGLALLSTAEVAVFSTGATEPLLRREGLLRALPGRERPLFIIDLGVPRNVSPDCFGVDGSYLYDLDDLKEMIRESLSGKAEAKAAAEALAAEAASECRAELDRPIGPPPLGSRQASGRRP